MSKFTTQLRFICETQAERSESGGYDDIDTILAACNEKQVIPDYPIFDESYRSVLNTKILMHYYTREICEETVGLWKLRMRARMNEIMPYYNKLYESELLEFNPLYDIDIKTEHKGNESNINDSVNKEISNDNTKNKTERSEINDKRTDNTNSRDYKDSATDIRNENRNANNDKNGSTNTDGNTITNNNKNINNLHLYSDTPQGGIQNFGTTDAYLTNMYKDDNKENNDSKTNSNEKQSYGEINETNETTNSKRNNNTEIKEDISNKGYENNKTNVEEINTHNNDSTKDTTNHVKFNSTDEYLNHVYGKQSGTSYAKLLEEYRKTFLNIDQMIIRNISDLFFALYE